MLTEETCPLSFNTASCGPVYAVLCCEASLAFLHVRTKTVLVAWPVGNHLFPGRAAWGWALLWSSSRLVFCRISQWLFGRESCSGIAFHSLVRDHVRPGKFGGNDVWRLVLFAVLCPPRKVPQRAQPPVCRPQEAREWGRAGMSCEHCLDAETQQAFFPGVHQTSWQARGPGLCYICSSCWWPLWVF